MNPIIMAVVLLAGWGVFAYSAVRRWKLMMVGAPARPFDQPRRRLANTLRYAFAQLRMRRYPLAGTAHLVIFIGFAVLLLRSLILWGRGFHEPFDFWLFGTENLLGQVYALLKDVFAVLVFAAAFVFLYYRTVKKLPRMTHNVEGLIIILIIIVMMAADVLYDGATTALHARPGATPLAALHSPRSAVDPGDAELVATLIDSTTGETRRVSGARLPSAPEGKEERYVLEPGSPIGGDLSSHVSFRWYEPAGSMLGMLLAGAPDGLLSVLRHAGFWTHSALVLIFLNLLPYSKHFHVITAIPNVYFQSLDPPGMLPKLEDIEGKLEREETLGVKRINQFSWKAILDFYTCTECGRCSDYCPATKTGKKLSPKHFTIDLRDFLYKHEAALVAAKAGSREAPSGNGSSGETGSDAESKVPEHQKDLVDGVIDPEVLWACTTCRACEQECPVFITYVDKIVDMRRYLVQERSEFPAELQSAFRGLETNANPWSFPAEDRAAWAEGLNIKTIAEHPEAEVLFWVGCAPAFDERAKKVTRATARLLQLAGVDFAILGTEEQCTGDVARRAGNEFLFQMLAQANVEVLNGHGVDKKKIVATCPHCFNTLKNEYPDFGGHYDVIHHTEFLAELVRQGKLKPARPVDKRVAYHDSCYLGRYNEVYDAPRTALGAVPGLTLLEPAATRDRGMCCGAGGAQMFKEEEHGKERVNTARTQQLLDTGPDAISSACPFCMRMLTDGLAEKGHENMPQLDVAEILLESVAGES